MSLSFEVKSSEIHQRGEAPALPIPVPETALVKVGIVGLALCLAPMGRMGGFSTTQRDPVS